MQASKIIAVPKTKQPTPETDKEADTEIIEPTEKGENLFKLAERQLQRAFDVIAIEDSLQTLLKQPKKHRLKNP